MTPIIAFYFSEVLTFALFQFFNPTLGWGKLEQAFLIGVVIGVVSTALPIIFGAVTCRNARSGEAAHG